MIGRPNLEAKVKLDTDFRSGEIDPRIFGGFLEHLGRAVYGGVYDPGNPRSDSAGFRSDVLDVLQPLRMPLIRYPGGNFVSNYDWRDGIGAVNDRPRRRDFAWRSIEPNTFGTDEFVAWCRTLDTAPYLVVNLGTLGAAEASALVEYCNSPSGSSWADLRIANGSEAPFDVRVWGLGNEMDGPWQAGHVPASVYAMRARQAGALMKGQDPTIELVVCGSSGNSLPTYMEWDRIVLEECWDIVDYIAAHRYSRNERGDSAWFLAEGVEIDQILDDYRSLLGYVRAVRGSDKRVYIAFDEWNVWYKNRESDGDWQVGTPLLEEIYNLEDALVCAQYLTSFIRNADLVKLACLAQIVNVIAPVLTRADGVLLQTIYHAFRMISEHARGWSLQPLVDSPTYLAGDRGQVAVLDAAASHDENEDQMAVVLINRSMGDALEVTVEIGEAKAADVIGTELLTGDDPKLANDWDRRDRVRPRTGSAHVVDGRVRIAMPPISLAVVRLQLTDS